MKDIEEITDVSVNDIVTLQLNDYFGDNDGDQLSYEVSVFKEITDDADEEIEENDKEDDDIEVDEEGNFKYLYKGGLAGINVIVSDNRGGEIEYDFYVNDTTEPYVRATEFDDVETKTDKIDNAIWVDGDKELYIYYNESVNLLDSSEISIINTERPFNVSIGVSVIDNLVKITPLSDLEEDETPYEVTIGIDALEDLNGNKQEFSYVASFTTKDTMEPQLEKVEVNGVEVEEDIEGSEYEYEIDNDIEYTEDSITPTDEIEMIFHENIKRLYDLRFENNDNQLLQDIGQYSYDTEENKLIFSVEQDILLDSTKYTAKTSIKDKYNNGYGFGTFTFTTGDVNAPKFDIVESNLVPYNGYQEWQKNSYYLRIENPNQIVITYDEDIFENTNFDKITLTVDGLNTDVLRYTFEEILPENSDGIKEVIPDENLEDVEITTEIINGNQLVITPSTSLIMSRPYTLAIPKNAVKDNTGLSVLNTKWINVTYSSSEKPEVRWSGANTNGKIIIENQSVLDTFNDITVVFNQLINESDNFDDIAIVDNNGKEIQGYSTIGIVESAYGSYDLEHKTWSNLEPGENYTLIVPENAVENAWGEGNDRYEKEFTVSSTLSMPGLSELYIRGIARVEERIYGHYLFEKYNNMVEGISEFQWYRCDDESGENKEAIEGATSIVYDVVEEDIGKFLFFEITPKLEEDENGYMDVLPPSFSVGFGPVDIAFSKISELSLLEVKEDTNTLLSVTDDINNYYEIEVDTNVTSVAIKAETSDSKAYVNVQYSDKLTEEYVNNNGTTLNLPLKLGDNFVEIFVNDEAGTSFTIYTVSIRRNTDEEDALKPDSFAEILMDEKLASEFCVGDVLKGNYYFYDDENRGQGEHQFNWYRSDDEECNNKELVHKGIEYQITEDDAGKYLFFEIVPETDTGVVGNSYMSAPIGPIDTKVPKDISTITIKSGSNNLLNNFNQNNINYWLSVPIDTSSVNIDMVYSDGATIRINDEEYLDNEKKLLLPNNTNVFLIDITDEQSIVKSYIININKTDKAIPEVDNVKIEGIKEIGETLYGTYDFVGGEGRSAYTWYREKTETGIKVIIATGVKEYVIKENDEDKYIFFEVQAISDDNIVGNSKLSNGFSITEEQEDTYTVIYEGNGNTGGSAPVDSNQYYENDTVTVLRAGTIVKDNYTFAGWNTESDGSGASYTSGSALTMGVANVILYAKWIKNDKHTVTYNGNGNTDGSAPTDDNQYYENDTVTVLGVGTLTRDNYTFEGWNTESDGSGASYTSGSALTMGTANITLYAKWTENGKYTVNIIAGVGGSVTPNGNQTIYHGNNLIITPTPDSGYSVANITSSLNHTITDNGDGTYTIENIQNNDNINVTFSYVRPIVTIEEPQNGQIRVTYVYIDDEQTQTVDVNSGDRIEVGTELIITAQADSGYRFSSWGDFTSYKTKNPNSVIVANSDIIINGVFYKRSSSHSSGGNLDPTPVEQNPVMKAIEEAKENTEGEKLVKVETIEKNNLGEYEQDIPKEFFEEKDTVLEVITPDGTVSLPNDMFDKAPEKDIQISIDQVDSSELDLPEEFKDKPVIDINLKVGGKKTKWRSKDKEITVSIPYKLSDEEKKNPHKVIAVYIDDDGNITPLTNSDYDPETGAIVFRTNHTSYYSVQYVDKNFDDIGSYTWAKESIEALAARGIINGVSENKFAPQNNIKRADFVVLMTRFFGFENVGETNFTDVEESEYYYDAIVTAKELGIITGSGDNRFKPLDSISRQDMMVIIERTLKIANVKDKLNTDNDKTLDDFIDKQDISNYAKDSVDYLIRKGIVSGKGDNISPKANTKRAEVAVLLYRLLGQL